MEIKIAMISPSYPPMGSIKGLIGGGETYLFNLASSLAELKQYVTLVTVSDRNHEHYLNDHLRFRFFKKSFFSVDRQDRFSLKLTKVLTSDRYELIHVHQLFSSLNILSCGVCKIRKIPAVLTDHGGGSAFLASLPFVCAKFPLSFLAVSEFSRKWLCYFGLNKKSYVIYGGVDTDQFRPDIQVFDLKRKLDLEGFSVISSIGRISPQKGVDVLIKSVPYLPQNIKLLICGPVFDVNYYLYLRKLANKIASERILFAGSIKSEKLPEYYNLSDIFVVPSVFKDYLGRYRRFPELFGLTKLEAMACGKPVVVSDVGGLPEQITHGKNGFVVKAGNERNLAEAINTLLEDEKTRKKIAGEGLRTVRKRFTWKAIAERVVQCYQSL